MTTSAPAERKTSFAAVPAVAVVAFALLGALSIYLQHVLIAFDEPYWGLFDNQLDLDVYRAGAQTVLDGDSLYDARLLGQMAYTYAPVSVLLFVPFAAMSFHAAVIVWSVLIFVALYFVITMSFRSLGRRIDWRLRVISVALIVISALIEPVRSTIWFGQINIFLMVLILWDLLRPEGSRLRGVGAGIAAGIKLTPLIFLAQMLVQRQWRTAFWIVGGFAVTAVIAFIVIPGDATQFYSGSFLDSKRVGVANTVGNQSIRGAIANLQNTAHPSAALWLALAIPAAALGIGASMLAHRRGHELLAITLTGLTSCAVSPVSWGHHWVWFVPLGVITAHYVMAPMALRRRVAAAVAGIALLLVTLAWPTRIDSPMTFANAHLPYGLYSGLFFKHGVKSLDWFTIDPYNWVFVVAAVSTLIVLGVRRHRRTLIGV